MSLIIPRLEGTLSLQVYSVLNFFNVPRKNRSPNPSLSGEHGAIYTLSLNAAYRMNLKTPSSAYVIPYMIRWTAPIYSNLAAFMFLSHSMIAIFAIFLLRLAAYRPLCALFWQDGPRRCLHRSTCSRTFDLGWGSKVTEQTVCCASAPEDISKSCKTRYADTRRESTKRSGSTAVLLGGRTFSTGGICDASIRPKVWFSWERYQDPQ